MWNRFNVINVIDEHLPGSDDFTAVINLLQQFSVGIQFQGPFLLGVAMLSSKGAAGVTGGGIIALAATLQQFPAVPAGALALIVGIDRILSQCRSITNFIGNAVATIVVSRWEGALDKGMLKAALSGRAPPLGAPPIEQDPD